MKKGARVSKAEESSTAKNPPPLAEGSGPQSYWAHLDNPPAEAGTQAELLSKMLKKDLPVLPGFVLLPKAYEEFLMIRDLDDCAKEALQEAFKFLKEESSNQFGVPVDLFQDGLILSISLEGPLMEVNTPLWGVGTGKAVLEIITDHILGTRETIESMPTDPVEQVFQTILRLYTWWNSDVLKNLRRIHNQPPDLPISIIIQAAPCASDHPKAVALQLTSRHPYTGEAKLYGRMVPGAAVDDPAYHDQEGQSWDECTALKGRERADAAVLVRSVEILVKRMVDVSLTFFQSKFWITRALPAPGGVEALVKTTIDLFDEGILTPSETIMAIRPEDLEQSIRKKLTDAKKDYQLARGRSLSPGWIKGVLCFDPDDAGRLREEKQMPVILCVEKLGHMRREMVFAVDALLAVESAVSPQAVSICMARSIPCLVGLSPSQLQPGGKLDIAGKMLVRGDMVVVDGDSGLLYDGGLAPSKTELSEDVKTLLRLTDQVAPLKVRANVTTPQEAAMAKALGASGIGLLRTEHLFRSDRRKNVMVQVIMAQKPEERRKALADLLPIQRHDFKAIFQEMPGADITVRLLDPPLTNYLPTVEDLVQELNEARMKGDFKISEETEGLLRKLLEIRETNPMMGLRGCRLGILYPEIYEIQVRAIFEAVCELKQEGIEVQPEILVPFVGHELEVKMLAHGLERAASDVMKEKKTKIPFVFGIMIETPRSAMVAGKLAEFVDFFSIGTNDLTQLCYGMCRDDAEGRYLLTFMDRGIYPSNPFKVIDLDGVGRLIRLAVQDGRWVNSKLVVGLAGAQAADAGTVALAIETGMDYISCPVGTLAVVKLMVAQAALRAKGLT